MLQYLLLASCLVLCSQVLNTQGSALWSPGGRPPWPKPVSKREQESGKLSSSDLEVRAYSSVGIGSGGFGGGPISKREGDNDKVDPIVLGVRDVVRRVYIWNGYRPRTKRDEETNEVNSRDIASRYVASGGTGTYRGTASR